MSMNESGAGQGQGLTASTIDTLQRAASLHNQGDLESAEAIYRKVLEENPENQDALHLLGYLAFQLGFWEEGAKLIEEAIVHAPNEVTFHRNLAQVYVHGGEINKAENAYRRALELKNDDPDLMNDLGNLLFNKEKGLGGASLQEAMDFFAEAVRLGPDSAGYRLNYGNALRDNKQIDLARACYEKALQIDPKLIGALSNLGLICHMEREYEEAIGYFEKLLKIDPADSAALNNMGSVFVSKHQHDRGIEYFEKAVKCDPKNPLIYFNMGKALMRRGRHTEALDSLQQSMELDSYQPMVYGTFCTLLRLMDLPHQSEKFARDALLEFPGNVFLQCEVAVNLQACLKLGEAEEILRSILQEHPHSGQALQILGIILIHTGQEEEIIEMFEKALLFLPDEAGVFFNYALALFSIGHLQEAWKYYRQRWETMNFPSADRSFPQQLWDGSSLQGKSILVYGEQGLGDEIRHTSLIPDLMQKGGDVSIECEPRLVDLVQRSFPAAKVYPAPYEEAEAGKIDFDYVSPILSLGEFFRPSIDAFPSDPDNAFFKADPDRVAFWKQRLEDLGPRPKIGLAWRGQLRSNEFDPWSVTIEELAPVLSLPGVDFVNLMYLECSEDRGQSQELYGANIHTWDDIDLKDDQDDLAGLISNLDLVICPLTSVGYLASGLAIPTYIFSPMKRLFIFLGNPDAPGWAPSVRYFRKDARENWDETVRAISMEVQSKFGL